MFLIDTDVLSALRRRARNPEVTQWIETQRSTDLFLSVISIGEIERGITRQLRRDPAFAVELTLWLDNVISWYSDRVLVVDLSIAHRWGYLSGILGHNNPDLLIAATALERGLTVVTRNVGHFEPTGVAVINPFES